MTENHEHEFPDELISAYLDGELSPDEKLRVEEQLMDSVDHRRLFEELKSLRHSLQSLPAAALDDEFAARVLRRAERELLADVAPADVVPADGVPADRVPPDKAKATPAVDGDGASLRPGLPHSQRGARRGLIWSIAATAAAVGLVVFGPLFNERPRDVTQLDSQPSEMQATPNEPAHARAGKVEDRVESAEPVGQQAGATTSAAGGEALEQPVAPLHVEPAAPSVRDSLAGDKERRKQLENFAADGAGQADPRGQTVAPQRGADQRGGISGRAASGAFAQDKDRSAGGESRQSAAEKAADAKVAGNARNLTARAFEKPDNAIDGGGGQAFGGGALPMAARAEREQWKAVAAAPAMAVVSLDVTHEALAGKFFDKLLRRHDIQVELVGREAEKVDRIAQAPPAEPVERDDAHALGSVGEEQGGAAAAAEAISDAATEVKGKQADAHEDVDVIYVVASQEQIDSLLHDLESQSADVLALAYDGVDLPKKNQADRAAPLRMRQFRELGDGKELELKRVEAKLGAAVDAKDELSQTNLAKPQTNSPQPLAEDSPVPVDAEPNGDVVSAAEQSEQQAGPAQSGYARRLALPLPNAAKVEAQFRRGNEGARAHLAPRADLQIESIAGDVVEDAAADDAPLADHREADAAPGEVAPALEAESANEGAAAPAAPPSNGAADDRSKMAKAKEQGLVRVLFVLRAAAAPPIPPVEATDVPASKLPR